MIQALIATIIELVALMFAMGAGAFFEGRESSKDSGDFKGAACIIISLMLAACALGVAAR